MKFMFHPVHGRRVGVIILLLKADWSVKTALDEKLIKL